MSEHFPFSPTGAALLCDWTDDDAGLQRIHWVNIPDGGDNFSATVGLAKGRNMLRFAVSDTKDERFADAAVQALDECLRESALDSMRSTRLSPPRHRAVTALPLPLALESQSANHRRRRRENAHRVVGGRVRPCD